MTLPDVFEWPMAVDNWDADYGGVPCVLFFGRTHVLIDCLLPGQTWRVEDVLAKLNANYQSLLLVSMYVDVDERDSKSHIIHVRVK